MDDCLARTRILGEHISAFKSGNITQVPLGVAVGNQRQRFLTSSESSSALDTDQVLRGPWTTVATGGVRQLLLPAEVSLRV
jgi:hypothetical protein